jgi:hypothetical protein
MDLIALTSIVPPQDVIYVMAFCGVCAALDAWLPAISATSRWLPLRRALSLLAQNYRNAANMKPSAVP